MEAEEHSGGGVTAACNLENRAEASHWDRRGYSNRWPGAPGRSSRQIVLNDAAAAVLAGRKRIFPSQYPRNQTGG